MTSIDHKVNIEKKRNVIVKDCKYYNQNYLKYAIRAYDRAVKRYQRYASRRHKVILEKYSTGNYIATKSGMWFKVWLDKIGVVL